MEANDGFRPDCGRCPIPSVSKDNAGAYQLYRMLSLPVIRDIGIHRLVFDAFGLKMTRQDAMELIYRLNAIHVTETEYVKRSQDNSEC